MVTVGTGKGTPGAAEPQPRGEAGGLEEDIRNWAYSKEKTKAGSLASVPHKHVPDGRTVTYHLLDICSAMTVTQQQRRDSQNTTSTPIRQLILHHRL